jgi:hypothetical protein
MAKIDVVRTGECIYRVTVDEGVSPTRVRRSNGCCDRAHHDLENCVPYI